MESREYCMINCRTCRNTEECFGCGMNGKTCDRIKRSYSDTTARGWLLDFLKERYADKSLR